MFASRKAYSLFAALYTAIFLLACNNSTLHSSRSEDRSPPAGVVDLLLLPDDDFYNQWMTNCTPERQRYLNEVKNRYKDLIRTRQVASCIVGGVNVQRGRTSAPLCKNWSEAQFKLAGSLYGALAQYRNLELACWDPNNPKFGTHKDEADISAELSQWCFVCASMAQARPNSEPDRPNPPDSPDHRINTPGRSPQSGPDQPGRTAGPQDPITTTGNDQAGGHNTPDSSAPTRATDGPLTDIDDLSQEQCTKHTLNGGWTPGVEDIDNLDAQNLPDRIVVPRGKTFGDVMDTLSRIPGPVGRTIDIVEYIRDPTGAIIDEIIWRVTFTPAGLVIVSYSAAFAAVTVYSCAALVLSVELSGWQREWDEINRAMNQPYEPPVTQLEIDSHMHRSFQQLDSAILDLQILLDRWDEEPNPPSANTRGDIMWAAKRVHDLARNIDGLGGGRDLDFRKIDHLLDRAARYDF
jgi:hypothetical protein